MVRKPNGRYEIVGIVSWGKLECALKIKIDKKSGIFVGINLITKIFLSIA